MPPLRGKSEDVEAKYDVTLTYPNLELHSASASGNVGLVHYALTHGQPVNSVLHGVLPLHAACSGGSSSVVKMLIERGADVNAPRLPRRYSDGKKSTAPSIGAAGSTPLHFAAANGHAAIVQILLTCGAIPDKSDKNGMTPEALAEINGHTDVIRVLRVWEHLQATDPSVSVADSASYQASEVDLTETPGDETSRHPSFGSRKGKERAFSFASSISGVSDSTAGPAVKLKHSLEGLLLRGRASRSGSFASTKPESVRTTDVEEAVLLEDDGSINEPAPSLHEVHPDSDANELHRVPSAASGSSQPPPLIRVDSGPSEDGHVVGDSPVNSSQTHLGPTPSRHNPSTSGSSRRPSLPSILEKAAHPGAAFRAAMRREHKEHQTSRQSPTSPSSGRFFGSSTSPPTDPNSPSSGQSHGFFRGRTRSNESTKAKHGNKYMSKHGLAQLFKRNHSPPSRSPSPPKRDKTAPIDAEQIEEGMEKLRRASLDLDLRTSRSLGEEDRIVARLPTSAPATQTTFAADAQIIPAMRDLTIDTSASTLSPSPSRERTVIVTEGRRTRSRQGSEVIAPSPLANEWATSSDSDTASSVRIRRSKTEVVKSSSQFNPDYVRPAFHAYRSNPSSPLRLPGSTRLRAVTSPSSPMGSPLRSASGTKLAGFGWDGPVDLRKVASVNQETKSRQEAAESESVQHSAESSRTTSQESIPILEEPEESTDNDQTPQASDGASDVDDTPTKIDERLPTSTPIVTAESEQIIDVEMPLAEPTVEPLPVDITEITQAVKQQGRYRGASIGSMSATSQSSRLSSPPSSSLRMSLLNSDDEPRSPTYPLYAYPDSASMPPPPPPPSSVGGRSRGKSVSSISSNPSEILSYFQASTPGTSLTPQSTLSMSRFPPVPENEVAHHPTPSRKVSNRAEAREAKKQAEDDVLQLAQLPPSLDSSRSLAAQLAAYGDSHALEQEFAERESTRGARKGMKSEDGDETSAWSGMSEGESWFSANSGTDSGSGMRSEVSSKRSRRKVVPPMSDIPQPMLPIDAPRSSLSSINSIYDKRAAAYRERMTALTSLPPAFPSSLASNRSSSSMRQRAASSESWLTAGAQRRQLASAEAERDKHPNISGPLPLKSSDSIYTSSFSLGKGRAKSHTVGSIRSASYKSAQIAPSLSPSRAVSHSSTKAPAPIADVVSARYAGMSPPPNVPQPPRLDPTSPHRSIFSYTRYSGQPHDGDDSDDNEVANQGLTVVENDWGGRVIPEDTFERKGRWGQLKGAIGKVGHRKPT